MKLKSNLLTVLAVTLACGLLQSASAAGGKSTTTPDTSTSVSSKPAAGGGGSGGGSGGGGKSTTPAPAPKPAPTPISSASLTFSASSSGSCTGDYSILPYYPTLLDLVVNVNVSSLNVPDGTVLYVNAVGAGGAVYPYMTAPMTVTAGACSSSQHYFIYPGTGVAGVTISDASGNILFAGN
jgi:hypothetical protein